MRIFLAGATGAIGGHLLPLLLADGHEVVALTRTPAKAEALRAAGARPVVADALDGDAVRRAVTEAAPEVVIAQQTALRGAMDLRRFDRWFAQTNRLRTEGTEHLLAGARAAGARRIIAQGYAGWPTERTGGPVKDEDDPWDPRPPRHQRETLAALRRQEELVTGASDLEGVVLRYGGFYGRGSSLAPDGESARLLRARRFPVVGDGAGVWSFCHLHDAATATVAALTAGRGGEAYNVVDDQPVAVAQWLPAMAELLGGPPPRRVPAWVGRLAVGEVGVSMMTRVRGASNAKARAELGWAPAYPSFREGLLA